MIADRCPAAEAPHGLARASLREPPPAPVESPAEPSDDDDD